MPEVNSKNASEEERWAMRDFFGLSFEHKIDMWHRPFSPKKHLNGRIKVFFWWRGERELFCASLFTCKKKTLKTSNKIVWKPRISSFEFSESFWFLYWSKGNCVCVGGQLQLLYLGNNSSIKIHKYKWYRFSNTLFCGQGWWKNSRIDLSLQNYD